MDALLKTLPLNRDHLVEQAFGSFRSTAAEVALAAFCAHEHPGAGHLEPFRGRLVGFQFILLTRFVLSWHNEYLSKKFRALNYGRGVFYSLGIQRNLHIYFFPVSGANTIRRVRPSKAGDCSIIDTS